MNNKSEKTFTDLFNNLQDDSENKVVTFDTFSNSIADDTKTSVDNDFLDNSKLDRKSFGDLMGGNFDVIDNAKVENKDEIDNNVNNEKDEVVVNGADVFNFGSVDDTVVDNKDEVENNVNNKEDEEVVNGIDVFNFGSVDDTVVDNKDEVENNVSNEKDEEVVNGTDDNFVIDNPLLSNVIELDESNGSKKSIDKLDLSNTKHFTVKVVPKKEPLFKFVIGVISYAFFIWLLLIGITLLIYVLDIKIRASKGDYSNPTFNAYVVLTGSMLPEIQVNDVVITKDVDADDLQQGDIITFASIDSRFSGTIITHRIIKKNPATDGGEITFQTKGDNNNIADSALVPASNIYGKVILKIPKLGYLQEFLATDGGWIIVILIPCLTVISYDVVKICKGLKRKKYDNIIIKK